MSNWLPWALVGLFIILLAAMPWRRTHPNHEFMLGMMRLLEDEDAAVLRSSSSGARPGKIETEGRQPIDMHKPQKEKWFCIDRLVVRRIGSSMQSQSVQSRPSESTVIFRNILLATDFSDASLTALQYAIGAGRPYDSRVLIAHIIPAETPASVPPEGMPVDPQSSRRHAEKEMSAFLRAAPLASVRYEVLIQSGEILAAITGLVTEHSIDLIVAGTHGRGGTKKLLLGSVAEQIFRGVACPVLTIGPHVEQDRPAKGEITKILYATDFEAGSLEAWPYAISIAEAHRAHLTLVHILGEDTPLFAREGTEASFKERLKQLLPAGKGLSLSGDLVVRFGSAAEGILQAAKDEDANLIVMGVRQNPSWSAAHLPWAIAHQVVCHSPCPVLTVRG